MIRCTKCVMPETQETIHFDSEGVCSVCRQHEYKQNVKFDGPQKKQEFDSLIQQYRDKYDYDCIVPFSGGKDSTFTLYHLVKEYKVKPLVVQFDHGFFRPKLLENNKRTFRKLGVDVHSFAPNWHVVRKLMLQSLLEKGDFCWHCHTGVYSYPMWVAIRYKVPLVIWGEPSTEYTSYYSYDQQEEVDEKRFNRIVNLGINADDMALRLQGALEERDLKPFKYPLLKELKALNYRSVCLGSYLPWDTKKQAQVLRENLGWEGDEVENVPPVYHYEKIECYMQGVRDYLKYIKRGFTRPTHLASLDLRNGRMTKDQALEMIRQYEGKRPASLDIFLQLLGITEEEFMEIAMSHAVSPYEHDPTKVSSGKKTKDFDQWSQEGAMSHDEALKQIRRWRDKSEKKSETEIQIE